MSKELLVTCHLCGQGGFSARGLRSHWCDAKGPNKAKGACGRGSTPLTKEEWEQAVLIAQHGPFAKKNPDWYQSAHGYSASCVIDGQIHEVKQMGIPMLRLVIEWHGVGKTVRRAAEARLRKLERQKAKEAA